MISQEASLVNQKYLICLSLLLANKVLLEDSNSIKVQVIQWVCHHQLASNNSGQAETMKSLELCNQMLLSKLMMTVESLGVKSN